MDQSNAQRGPICRGRTSGDRVSAGAWAAAEHGAARITGLSDDLLVQCFAQLDDATLRRIARTCRRWAALLRERRELWQSVRVELPPKRSRGRDRRNSYTTPCALSVERLGAWLTARSGAIAELAVGLQYPDALGLLPMLLPPLAPALRRLVLQGSCADWPYVFVDWRWLAGMTQLESLQMWDALPDMGELLLPPSLTELHIDRVGGGDQDTEGWDELPPCFARLAALRSVTLGAAATYLLQADEESALAPLRAARGLRELRLPQGALSGVPDVVGAFAQLTLLSFRDCDRLDAFGEACVVKQDAFAPLAALTQLRHLDFSGCALESLPPHLGALPLRTLLLGSNRLTWLPASGAGSTGPPTGQAQGQPPAPTSTLPVTLEHLELSANPLRTLPGGCLACLTHLTSLDLARCWTMHTAVAEWRALLCALPTLRVLTHSCELLDADVGGCGGDAAVVGRCSRLQLRRVPPAVDVRSGLASSKRSRSDSSMQQLEAEAAEALLTADHGMSATSRRSDARGGASTSASADAGPHAQRCSSAAGAGVAVLAELAAAGWVHDASI